MKQHQGNRIINEKKKRVRRRMTLALSLFFPLRVAVKPTPSNPLCPATRYKLGVNKKQKYERKRGKYIYNNNK